MTDWKDPFNPGLRVGDVHSGFEVLQTAPLQEIAATYYALRHLRTGARYAHISRDDAENAFSVALKTVPRDSTGVAHILEHTVLCGSRKYPVRDPFFSMLKRSLNSFMNAFTASDWTMYPFATPNRKDFYNLMSVYLDAVFFPRLDLLSFRQEGHRLEVVPSGPDGGDWTLAYKGVVYNEMKGAMSSPDQVCQRSLLNAMYPDTTYRHNSGGDPAVIPTLTHADLVAFHRRHYHPSNAFFYTYGNLPLAAHLEVMDGSVLAQFDCIDPDTDVPCQPRWDRPRVAEYFYPLDKDAAPGNKSQACVAWLTADIRSADDVLVLTLLEEILLGNAASPLRKALMESGLGTALCDATGFDADNRDTLFACGLKDVARDAAPRVEAIVLSVLDGLAGDGIDPELVAAAVHQIEFHRKEVTNSPYPYCLKLLLAFSGAWFHGGDPVRVLDFDQSMRRIRERIAAGPFLEEKIRSLFLDNPHRMLFSLHPDQAMAEQETERVRAALEAVKAGLTKQEVDAIREESAALAALQDAGENLSVLPTLVRADIPPSVRKVPEAADRRTENSRCYPAATAGIVYASTVFGLGGLPEHLVPLVPFFCYAATRVGTARHSYEEMARRIDTHTGGVGFAARVRTHADAAGRCSAYLQMDAKCLVRKQVQMMGILAELVGCFDFSNRERLRQLLLEYRAGLDAMVVHNGHRLAMSLASRRFLPQGALSEAWYGVLQLRYVKDNTEDLSPEVLSAIGDALTDIARFIFVQGNIRSAYVGEAQALDQAASADAALREALLPNAAPTAGDARFEAPAFFTPADAQTPVREGWHTGTAVSFVAQCLPTVRMDHPDAPVLAVMSKMLRSLYLHREIREKGGAYGGFSLYSPETGIFSFASYRDPRILGTLGAFEKAPSLLMAGDFSDRDINEALLQVCAEIDKPDPPGTAARKAFSRALVGLTDDVRQRYKAALLATTREQVVAVTERYFAPGRMQPAVAVISGRERLEAVNQRLKDAPLTLKAI